MKGQKMGTTTINARIDDATKAQAVDILRSLGMNTSQAITLFFKQIIYNRGIPFELKIPNRETSNAITELESGKGARFASVDDLFKDLDH